MTITGSILRTMTTAIFWFGVFETIQIAILLGIFFAIMDIGEQ